MLTRRDVVRALDEFTPRPAERPDLKRAAVAITLVDDGGAFLLTSPPRWRSSTAFAGCCA